MKRPLFATLAKPALATSTILACCIAVTTAASACEPGKGDLGVSRIVEIDATEGPLFGRVTKFDRQPSFLKPKEVVLTFDDGPTPKVTASILEALRNHCTRATFFPIGKRAILFPDLIERIHADGHTIGGHTWSHPNNLRRLEDGDARDQIERGFAAIDLVAKVDLAPFFRFPGLNDGRELLAYTQLRKLAVFSVDVISDDSFARSTRQLIRTTRKRTRANNGGILLFHDLKKRTALAIPDILANLKADGFKVVHLVSAHAFRRDKGYDSVLAPRIAKARKLRGGDVVQRNEIPLGLTVPVTVLKPQQAPFDGKPRKRKPVAQPRPAAVTGPRLTRQPTAVSAGSSGAPAPRAVTSATDQQATEPQSQSNPTPTTRTGRSTGQSPSWRTTIGPDTSVLESSR